MCPDVINLVLWAPEADYDPVNVRPIAAFMLGWYGGLLSPWLYQEAYNLWAPWLYSLVI